MVTKNKVKSINKKYLKKDDAKSIKEYFNEKLEKLSWHMGKKELKKRAELYDR